MPVVDVMNLEGKKVGQLELADDVFGVKVNQNLLHEAVRHHLAGERAGTHKTKDKSEVSGSGKKLWKQKGTGGARVGSIRSPRWHGPPTGAAQLRLRAAKENDSGRAAFGAVGEICGAEADGGGWLGTRFAQDQAVPPGTGQTER